MSNLSVIIRRSSRRKDSTFHATAVVLRKTGSTKIFAAAILLMVAAITITASGLGTGTHSGWNGVFQTDSMDSPATVSDMSDVLSLFDTMTSTKLILPEAFADHLVVDAGPALDIVMGGSTTISGSNVTGANLTEVLTYSWKDVTNKVSEADEITFNNASLLHPIITAPSNTTIPVRILYLFVSINNTYYTGDTVVVYINDPPDNTLPEVYITPTSQTVTEGATVSIPWTATDADNNNLTYAWSSNHSSEITFSSQDSSPTTFTAPDVDANTTITITLTVNDDTGDGTDTMQLIVQDSNTLPEVYITPTSQTVTEGATVSIPWTATDADNNNLTYAWSSNHSSEITFSSQDSSPTTFTAPDVDANTTITITLTVNDDTGDGTDTMQLIVQDSNTLPEVYITPTSQTVTEGATVSIPWTATDADNNNLTYAWSSNHSSEITFSSQDSSPTTFTAPDVDANTTITITLTVNDDTGDGTDTMQLIVQDSNTLPEVYITPTSQTVTEGATVSIPWTATDADNNNLTYAWSSNHSSEITFSSQDSSPTTFTAPDVDANTTITITLTVNDDTGDGTDTMQLIVQDSNTLPEVYITPTSQTVTEGATVSIPWTATDADNNNLTYAWSSNHSSEITFSSQDSSPTTFTAPDVDANTTITITLTVNDDTGDGTDTMQLIVQDSNTLPEVYITPTSQTVTEGATVSIPWTATDADNNNLTYAWSSNHSSEITFSSQDSSPTTFTAPDVDANTTITITLTVNDDTGDGTDTMQLIVQDSNTAPTVSKKSSSSIAPIVDLHTLAQARIVDIPQSILEQVSLHDESDPLKPIPHNGMFDFPLAINGYCYLLDDTTNTITPQTVTAGQSTEIAFTVYTKKDLAYFILYLNMQGNDVNYANSDTYITYTSDGTVSVTDPHKYIADATITVTQEDDSMPEKKTVSITIYFDEPMGSTNMVAYMWNTDRKAAFVKMIGAIEVVAAAETSENDASTTSSSNSAGSGSEPDTSNDDQGSGSTPSVIKSGIVIVGDDDDDDDAQTLSLIRMWSGFASESLTDADFLKLLNLDYPGVDIPNWMMTELGALVSNGDVTVEEFRTALIYMLEMLTA